MAYIIERDDQYITRLADFILKEYGIMTKATLCILCRNT